MAGIVYIVATPIGNLGDITFRGVETLKTVDFIAAEDTRVSVKLLNHLDITKPMVSYYEHNQRKRGEEIINRILAGESCALISDAGTPAISDPGEDLVRLCAENNITVITIPGACAAISALTLSGLDTGRFCFEGFLSTSKKSRKEHLAQIKTQQRTMIFYEAPHKLKATLADFLEHLGDRNISICRELTKMHEEVLRFPLSRAVEHFNQNQPRGEFVLVLEGAAKEEPVGFDEAAILTMVVQRTEAGETLRDAVKFVSAHTGMPKNRLYQLALAETEEK